MDNELEKVLLGYCAVDSGQLIIADPCYLRNWKDGEAFPEKGKPSNHYAEACKATASEQGGGEVLVSGIGGVGVAFSSGYGDGNYPVYGFKNAEGRIMGVFVDMGAGEEEDDDAVDEMGRDFLEGKEILGE